MAEKHTADILAYCLGSLHHTYVLCWRSIAVAQLFSDQSDDSHVAGKTREEIAKGYSCYSFIFGIILTFPHYFSLVKE